MLGQAASGAIRSLLRVYSILFLLSFPVLPAAAIDANCSSFATTGAAAAQFNYYRFYDFRNVSVDSGETVYNVMDPNNVTAGASTSDMLWSLDWERREGLLYPAAGQNLLPIDYQPDKVAISKRNTT
jgi:hypothetical protein